MGHQTNNDALIGWNYTMFTNRPPLGKERLLGELEVFLHLTNNIHIEYFIIKLFQESEEKEELKN